MLRKIMWGLIIGMYLGGFTGMVIWLLNGARG